MKIEKKFNVNAPQSVVWEFITSPEKVAPCVPGCEGAEGLGEGKYKVIVKVGIGPINTKFELDVDTLELNPPNRAVYSAKGDEGGKASRIKSETTLALTANGSSTGVHYISEVSIVGRLGKFGSGLVNKVADSIGDQFVANIKKAIETNLSQDQEVTSQSATEAEPISSPSLFSNSRYVFAGVVLLIICAALFYR